MIEYLTFNHNNNLFFCNKYLKNIIINYKTEFFEKNNINPNFIENLCIE